MEKFSLDYSGLQNTLEAPLRFKVADVQSKIQKVAFDVVRFIDPELDIDGLWQIQHSDDGDYIVARYDEVTKQASTRSPWEVVAGQEGTSLHIFYKSAAVKEVSLADLGIPGAEIKQMANYLPKALQTNASMVRTLLSELSPAKKTQLVNLFPELGAA